MSSSDILILSTAHGAQITIAQAENAFIAVYTLSGQPVQVQQLAADLSLRYRAGMTDLFKGGTTAAGFKVRCCPVNLFGFQGYAVACFISRTYHETFLQGIKKDKERDYSHSIPLF